jgi:hypothetical protein
MFEEEVGKGMFFRESILGYACRQCAQGDVKDLVKGRTAALECMDVKKLTEHDRYVDDEENQVHEIALSLED